MSYAVGRPSDTIMDPCCSGLDLFLGHLRSDEHDRLRLRLLHRHQHHVCRRAPFSGHPGSARRCAARMLHVCCMCVACVLFVCCMCVACVLHVCCMYVSCESHVRCMHAACVVHHIAYIACMVHVCCIYDAAYMLQGR